MNVVSDVIRSIKSASENIANKELNATQKTMELQTKWDCVGVRLSHTNTICRWCIWWYIRWYQGFIPVSCLQSISYWSIVHIQRCMFRKHTHTLADESCLPAQNVVKITGRNLHPCHRQTLDFSCPHTTPYLSLTQACTQEHTHTHTFFQDPGQVCLDFILKTLETAGYAGDGYPKSKLIAVQTMFSTQ